MRNILLILVIAAACGGKSTPEPTTPATPVVTADDGSAAPTPAPEPEKAPEKVAEPAPPPPPPEPDAFMKLSRDEKMKIMKTKVMPAMAKAFKSHDAKEFAKFTCKSCHGKGVADDTYKMPNAELPPLDFAALKAGKQDPKMAEFMGKVVQPDMAKLLGVPAYDEAHPNAFGCLTCHTMKQ
ncbi:MAG: hypothetical protein H0T79_06295 [Deltaproteobacteria bacterium]|nr:hypothetical protein [Deltaproteobacteria bacterium]